MVVHVGCVSCFSNYNNLVHVLISLSSIVSTIGRKRIPLRKEEVEREKQNPAQETQTVITVKSNKQRKVK